MKGENKMTHIDPQKAFNQAVGTGRLSSNSALDNWAGNYMYMGTDEKGKHWFKNSLTREYIA